MLETVLILADETGHMINKEVLSALARKESLLILDVGGCLLQAETKGASLDVFENEPDVPKELFSLDNVVLSPHSAVFTGETFKDLEKLVVEHWEAVFSNNHYSLKLWVIEWII
ncbi:Glyoxylate/hydroxypyruvate reductase HPR3 [Melia azedarach]|uniref:Glyoxylate/hydroxypyruvate reductase HPR3 n=1 Tax=Melia azedarach TaxID=155640 RepID=A0ACC1YU72_MELAZ|nr:Glyoxylate/hydroxypyruvate reductase HPR3 [Melia azedarach]